MAGLTWATKTFSSLRYLPSVSRIVAFIVKKYLDDTVFACFIGKLDSSHVVIEKKIKGQMLKYIVQLELRKNWCARCDGDCS